MPEQHPRRLRGGELVERRLTVHARKHPGAISLCGQDAGAGGSTTRRSEVTCGRCLAEIERRLAERNRDRSRDRQRKPPR
jgi:hypothetical protein